MATSMEHVFAAFFSDIIHSLVYNGYTKTVHEYDRFVAKACTNIVTCYRKGIDFTSIRDIVNIQTQLYERVCSSRSAAIEVLSAIIEDEMASSCPRKGFIHDINRRLIKLRSKA